jgi:hypothetical protein
VVALGWLDGISPEPAIRVPSVGFVRWKGSEPGEQAELLPDGSYRWVGPDGSVVSCVAPSSAGRRQLRCVGMDNAGDTAVTDGAGGPRLVYGPDGRWLGRFESSGVRMPVGGTPLAMAKAVQGTGVDMASLVDFATRQQPFSGGVAGDPHLITAGRLRVSTQRAGDFLARTGDPAHQIQIRTAAMPYQTDASYVTAAAVGVPGHRIEFVLSGALSVDGKVVDGSGGFRQISVPDGPTLGLWPPDADGVVDAAVLWSDGSTVAMSADSSLGLTVISHIARGAATGLFGGNTEDSVVPSTSVTTTPDLPDAGPRSARGDFLGRPGLPSDASLDQVVDSWRVPPGQSLLTGDTPVAQPTASAAISPAATLAAEKTCVTGPMAESDDLAACVFDVARTGDDGYVVHDGELATAATGSKLPTLLAAGWPALVLGTATSPQSLDLGSQIEAPVPASGRRLYRLTLTTSQVLTIAATPCGRAVGGLAPGGAALRLFDAAGNAVSARQSCGTAKTEELAAGTYFLVLAGPTVGSAAAFRVRVG